MKYLLIIIVSYISLNYHLTPDQTLSVCFIPNNKPFSYTENSIPKGFDVDIAQAIADELDVNLHIQWLPETASNHSSLSGKARQALSTKACHTVAGYPFHESALGAMTTANYNITGSITDDLTSYATEVSANSTKVPSTQRSQIPFKDRLVASQPYSLRVSSVQTAQHRLSSEINAGFVVVGAEFSRLKNINAALATLSRQQKLTAIANRYVLNPLPLAYPHIERE